MIYKFLIPLFSLTAASAAGYAGYSYLTTKTIEKALKNKHKILDITLNSNSYSEQNHWKEIQRTTIWK